MYQPKATKGNLLISNTFNFQISPDSDARQRQPRDGGFQPHSGIGGLFLICAPRFREPRHRRSQASSTDSVTNCYVLDNSLEM